MPSHTPEQQAYLNKKEFYERLQMADGNWVELDPLVRARMDESNIHIEWTGKDAQDNDHIMSVLNQWGLQPQPKPA